MSLITLPTYSKNDFEALIEPLKIRQVRTDQVWRDLLSQNGWLEFSNELQLHTDQTLGNTVELAPFLRIGRLKIEPEFATKKEFEEAADYLKEKINYPAFVQLRNKAACVFYSQIAPERIAALAQIAFLRLFCTLDPSVVHCTAIDLQTFGSTFSLLSSAVPKLELLTDSRAVQSFFDTLPDKLKARNQTKGFGFQFLHEFNRAHRDSAVPYHFVFIGSYQKDLSAENQASLARLLSGANAAKAGIYFIIIGHNEDYFQNNADFPEIVEVESDKGPRIEINDPDGLMTIEESAHSILEIIPDGAQIAEVTKLVAICKTHLSKRKIEPVKLPLPKEQSWSHEAWKQNAADGISAAIGKSRAEVALFRLGSPEIVHNALVGGAVGTGKTNLLHAIILQVLGNYSPREINLSILDYKNGTEFGVYDGIPHLYALSLGAATKFGLDLLNHFRDLLTQRAELFKEFGVSNLSGYRKKAGLELVRHLIVIDEFQVLLGDRKRGDEAKQALEDLIRRGRSFGFNFILASQSLKDDSLTSASKSNIGCRICLRLSENDCTDFLSMNNSLPSTFEYAGQAVLNNQEGHPNGNTEFTVAYYSEEEVSNFVALLKLNATNKSFVASPAPYIFHDGQILLRADMPTDPQSKSLLLGIEEGIPTKPFWVSLDPSQGPVMIVGLGKARDLFEENLHREIQTLRGKTLRCVGFNDLGEAQDLATEYMDNCTCLDSIELLILKLRPKDALNSSVSMLISGLLLEAKCKIYVIVDRVDNFSGIEMDRNRAECLVVLDQRSFAHYGFGTDLVGHTQVAGVFIPGEETPLVIKMPKG
jgi:hypothetical protein